jgi:hypothetical protein
MASALVSAVREMTMDDKLHRFSLVGGGCAAIFAAAGALALATSAIAANPITIWIVGSPHTNDLPKLPAAVHIREEARRSGYDLSVETFHARGFADAFADAVARGTPPDILVFDNMGVMDGITTRIGRFEGVGRDPTVRSQFVKVTGAFDELLGPQRGWTYLFTSSSNHVIARNLALNGRACIAGSGSQNADEAVVHLVTEIAIAYLKGDAVTVQAYADAERIPIVRLGVSATAVGSVRVCGAWSNDNVAFASVTAAYESDRALGEATVLVALRKSASQWRLLVVTRDPISTSAFVNAVPRLFASLPRETATALPIPATLTAPPPGEFPHPASGQRFGSFTWTSSPSSDVVAEVAEFAYGDDVRLVLVTPKRPAGPSEVSAGQLWTTRGEWSWRIWSIARTGELAFSESRTFVH